jgi:hypothetical protein
MFPRNIRRISPWKIAQIVYLFDKTIKRNDWNQDSQNIFRRALEETELIRPGVPYDPHSGGPRTYEAQMKCLGLIFQRADNSIWLTKAGYDLARESAPLPILQSLLLHQQYPSVYSRLSKVKIHPQVKIKPFLFVLEILHDPEIKYLTREELCIPVIYGHNRECLKICIEKILKIRNGVSLRDVIDDKEHDLYSSRSRKSTFDKRLIDVRAIANTCKNYLQACCLVGIDNTQVGEQIYFNTEMEEIYQQALAKADEYIALDNEEAFQRRYGAWDGRKDTRSLVLHETIDAPVEEAIILSHFMKHCGERIVSDIPESFYEEMNRGYGFERSIVKESLEGFLPKTLDYFEATFIGLSVGGIARAVQFEKATCEIFRNRLHFAATHTGSLKRPNGEKGGYADVFAVALDEKHCGIIDTKAISNYSLPSDDFYKMTGNYIPNYKELAPERLYELEFVTYVAPSFSNRINTALKKVAKKTGKPCSAISAKEIISVAKKKIEKTDQCKLREVFAKGEKISSFDFVFQK